MRRALATAAFCLAASCSSSSVQKDNIAEKVKASQDETARKALAVEVGFLKNQYTGVFFFRELCGALSSPRAQSKCYNEQEIRTGALRIKEVDIYFRYAALGKHTYDALHTMHEALLQEYRAPRNP